MIDISMFMKQLSLIRPVFHSEADFQHAFAWQLHQLMPDLKIRLEFPRYLDRWIYLDIWAEQAAQLLAIELKYKTAKIDLHHNGEHFHLKNQAAQPLGRYDFLKDVERLERICTNHANTVGFAIMLTNESIYWRGTNRQGIDEKFRLYEGKKIQGTLEWLPSAAPGTIKGREEPIELRENYDLNWVDYDDSLSDNVRGKFRYLSIKIDPTM